MLTPRLQAAPRRFPLQRQVCRLLDSVDLEEKEERGSGPDMLDTDVATLEASGVLCVNFSQACRTYAGATQASSSQPCCVGQMDAHLALPSTAHSLGACPGLRQVNWGAAGDTPPTILSSIQEMPAASPKAQAARMDSGQASSHGGSSGGSGMARIGSGLTENEGNMHIVTKKPSFRFFTTPLSLPMSPSMPTTPTPSPEAMPTSDLTGLARALPHAPQQQPPEHTSSSSLNSPSSTTIQEEYAHAGVGADWGGERDGSAPAQASVNPRLMNNLLAVAIPEDATFQSEESNLGGVWHMNVLSSNGSLDASAPQGKHEDGAGAQRQVREGEMVRWQPWPRTDSEATGTAAPERMRERLMSSMSAGVERERDREVARDRVSLGRRSAGELLSQGSLRGFTMSGAQATAHMPDFLSARYSTASGTSSQGYVTSVPSSFTGHGAHSLHGGGRDSDEQPGSR